MSTPGVSMAAFGTLWRTLSGSLALVTGRLSATELEKGIREKYSERLELETARQQASLGLTEGEWDLFRRHLAPGARVLDVGCAGGRVSLALGQTGFRMIGVDLNEAMVGQAAELIADAQLMVPFQVMDARSLAFRNESFDTVLLVGSVICYIRGRRNRRHVLREARRVLRPGGTILVVTPSRESAWRFRSWSAAMRLVHRLLGLLRRAAIDWEPGDRFGPAWSGDGTRLVYWYMYAPAELESDLVASGFEIVESYPNAYMMTFVGSKPRR
jgi:SAM-dependent methyltransferase